MKLRRGKQRGMAHSPSFDLQSLMVPVVNLRGSSEHRTDGVFNPQERDGSSTTPPTAISASTHTAGLE